MYGVRVRACACAWVCVRARAIFGEGRKKEGAAACVGTVHWRAAAAAAAQAAADAASENARAGAGGRGRARLGGGGGGEAGPAGVVWSTAVWSTPKSPNGTNFVRGKYNHGPELSPEHQHSIKIRMSIRSNHLHAHKTRYDLNKILVSL